MNIYDIGDRPTITGTFKNAADALVDPSDVTVQVKKPDGTDIAYTYLTSQVTRESVGVFSKLLPQLDQHGLWRYRFDGDGDVEAAGEDKFRVRKSAF